MGAREHVPGVEGLSMLAVLALDAAAAISGADMAPDPLAGATDSASNTAWDVEAAVAAVDMAEDDPLPAEAQRVISLCKPPTDIGTISGKSTTPALSVEFDSNNPPILPSSSPKKFLGVIPSPLSSTIPTLAVSRTIIPGAPRGAPIAKSSLACKLSIPSSTPATPIPSTPCDTHGHVQAFTNDACTASSVGNDDVCVTVTYTS